jgi:hypothetical protein
METAAGRLLLGERAEALLQMPVVEALSSLRSLTVQLPRQDDRTTEQIHLRQGGRLVAITGEGMSLRRPAFAD